MDKNIKKIFDDIITSIGDDPERDGLLDTPRRVLESYKEILDGYGKKSERYYKGI